MMILCAWIIVVALVGAILISGTRFAWIAPLVFAPPFVWPLGLVLLAVLSWLAAARGYALGLLLTAVFIAGPLLGWRSHRAVHAPLVPGTPGLLRVLTWNQGQHYTHSLAPFITQMQPDVIAYQEALAVNRQPGAAPELQPYEHIAKVGEFMLASRFPITSTALVPTATPEQASYGRYSAKAARFVIDFQGQSVVIYSLHVISPRFALDHALGIEKDTNTKLRDDSSFWPRQRAMIELLIARIEAETLPTLVLGDWNMPPLGPYYRQMTRRFQDAHAAVGQGYGFTCPGDQWTPLTLGEPWLRIDYVLCNSRWEPLECYTEEASKAQHRAVAAVLRLR